MRTKSIRGFITDNGHVGHRSRGHVLKAICIERGIAQYETASQSCSKCDKPALRTWKNIGYCKAHAPKSV